MAGSGWLVSYGGSGNKAKFQKLLPENKACGRRRRKRKRRRRDRPPTPPIYTTFSPAACPLALHTCQWTHGVKLERGGLYRNKGPARQRAEHGPDSRKPSYPTPPGLYTV